MPFFVSYYRADRILKAQVKADASERMIPVLALVVVLVVGFFAPVYYQSQLNKVWDSELTRGAELRAA